MSIYSLKAFGNMQEELYGLCKRYFGDVNPDDVYKEIQELYKPFLDQKFNEKD